jgi:cytochrome c peroxidase
MRFRLGFLLGTLIMAAAQGAEASDAPFYADNFTKTPAVAAMTAIGRALFFDPKLSASGKVSCASCHDPRHAFGPANDMPVQRAGRDGRRFGVRAAPSLTYTQNIPPFVEHYFEDEGDDSIDQGAAGGRTWDGRAQSVHDQARLPLFSPFEMANSSSTAVLAKVRRADYALQFTETFGDTLFDDSALAFKAILMALETFQQSAAEFYPYSSRYDAWLRHEAALTAAQARGLTIFNDPQKGNCARCHPSSVRAGAFPQFTDFGYAAVGVPRNRDIPANRDRRYFDLGLCGPLRTDLADRKEYCGMFRTPSLRNVALRRVFFHNGAVHRLEDAVRFYAERDSEPQRWYPRGSDGTTLKFDDLPLAYQGNIDQQAPFGRHAADLPALSDADIKDLVAFLETLTDGYSSRPRD